MTRLIVDTSVAVKWVVPEIGQPEDNSEYALSLLPSALLAPDCIVGEFANALYKKIMRGEIGDEQAREALAILSDIVDVTPTPPLIAGAFEMSLRLRHPVHDCVFLVLAMSTGGRLITADEKFVLACRRCDPALPIASLREHVAE